MTGYIPAWENGQEVGVGLRDAAGRYKAIHDYVCTFDPDGPTLRSGFTVLEVGAYNGYFCHRLHDDFGCQCLAVDDRPFLTSRPGTNVIRKLVTPAEIRGLGAFDAVLCLSVLHHRNDWMDFMAALTEVGEVIFLELANPDEPLNNDAKTNAMGALRAANKLGGVILTETPPMGAQSPLRPLYVFDKSKVPSNSIGGTS